MDEPLHRGALGTARLTTLADGVFAIVLTLLVLDLHAPTAATQAQLLSRLRELTPQFVSFLVSYIVLGILWYGHHMEMHWIVRSDRVHLGITLAFLLAVSFIPFSASLMGRNEQLPLAATLYGGNLCLAGLVRYGHWRYATGGCRLTPRDLPPDFVRHVQRVFALVAILYAAATAVAWLSPAIAIGFFLLIPVLYVIPARQTRHLTSLKSAQPATRE
jgi:TMEM175 potassium channel family protein